MKSLNAIKRWTSVIKYKVSNKLYSKSKCRGFLWKNLTFRVFTRIKFSLNNLYVLRNLQKAETLIRQQLEIKETPDLYCSLGEVTKEVEYFQKAIDLSKGRSARAYRMLAKFQFSKEQVISLKNDTNS